VLGIGLGLYLLREYSARGASPAAFVLFIGLAISVTAFPVLARIIESRGLFATELGGLALAIAALVDVVAWTELAVVQAMVGGGATLWRTALFVLYGAGMLLIVRPLLHRLIRAERSQRTLPAGWTFPVVLAGAALSGAATEAMGMHFILGSFLFGMAIPRTGGETLHADISDGITRLTSVLLPVYFVVAGLQINLASLKISSLWQFGIILFVAVVSKLGGTYLGLRTQGMSARPSMAVASLMNTRGLTGPIVVGIGLQMHLFGSDLYALMIVMMLVTTLMTGPLLSLTFRGTVKIPGSIREGGESARVQVTAPS
jgi:Kef-type K+ transport system membrane component KefB